MRLSAPNAVRPAGLAILAAGWVVAALMVPPAAGAAGAQVEPAYEYSDKIQYAEMPLPLQEYEHPEGESIGAILRQRAERDPFNVAATIIFFCAVIHTFMSATFNRLGHKYEHLHRTRIEKEGRTARDKPHEDAVDDVSFRSTLFHFLGEIEAVFGIWVIPLALAAVYFYDWDQFALYIGRDVNFTEPLFVVVIMAIAASRPIIRFSEYCLRAVASIGGGTSTAWWWSILTIAPILGSFITEPAAMTIAALLLARKFYALRPSAGFAYATLGLLFVNISVGGTLTHFAAPPVLMVAERWGYDTLHMLTHFGWKSVLGIIAANSLYYFAFRKQIAAMAHPETLGKHAGSPPPRWTDREDPVPFWVTIVHIFFLAWTVMTNHFPALFIGAFLFFLAFVQATQHHQNRISLRGPMLVGFFLAGLVIHGGCQGWWIEPILTSGIDDWFLMLGATGLTAFNDNAAITFLASQAPDLAESAKYAVLAGAVAGGGLTVIANAPNPAGQSILNRFFPDGISPIKLLLGALVPTAIMVVALMAITQG